MTAGLPAPMTVRCGAVDRFLNKRIAFIWLHRDTQTTDFGCIIGTGIDLIGWQVSLAASDPSTPHASDDAPSDEQARRPALTPGVNGDV